MNVTPFLEVKPAPRTIFDSLSTRASQVRFMLPTPEGGFRAVTWHAYGEAIRNAAMFLASQGFHAGDRAAIFAPNSVEWVESAMAIQAAGGVMVPVYPANTAAQAAFVARHSDATFLFVETPQLLQRVFEAWADYENVSKIITLGSSPLEPGPIIEGLRAAGKQAPPLAEVERKLVAWSRVQSIGAALDRETPGEFERMLGRVSNDQVAEMLYTSGTSGNPKGVPLTHHNVGVNAQDWLRCNAPSLSSDDIDLLWLPMSHIFGFGELTLGNLLGWTTYLSEASKVVGHLAQVRPTIFMSVPQYWEKLSMLAQQRASALSTSLTEQPGDTDRGRAALHAVTGGRLKFCLSGGAGLKREVKEFFYSSGLLITEGYGLTECSPTLTLNRPDAFRFDSVGRPVPSVEVRLAEDGEILAKGPSVFGGYHKDLAATKEAFTEDGWFKTGDVGRFTDDGFLQIVDRKKDILVTAGGKNVPPANIELKFRDDPFIAHVVVAGDGQKFLVAGVWLNQQAVATHFEERAVDVTARPAAIRALVQRRIDEVNAELASYETIKKFTIIDEPLTVEAGYLTSTLKVRRKQVNTAFKKNFEALYETA